MKILKSFRAFEKVFKRHNLIPYKGRTEGFKEFS
jgi:hypothetical protein